MEVQRSSERSERGRAARASNRGSGYSSSPQIWLYCRVERNQKLDGIVMFADDSNMQSMDLFDEVQKVRGIKVVSVGILMHKGGSNSPLHVVEDELVGSNSPLSIPVQGLNM